MDDCAFEKLTEAERCVLRTALGRTNDGVAAVLGISPSTVATHLLAARRKLGSPPKGEAARRFVAWEESQQKSPRSFPTMVEPAAAGHSAEVDAELVREVRTPFVFLDQPASAARLATIPDQGPLLRIVLLLTLVVLALACIRFLPDLRERAEEAGRVIRPLLDETGVRRSG